MFRVHRHRRTCVRLALAVLLCLVAFTPLQAQTTSASVSGSVKDAQGSVLPGATITLTSKTQGTTLTVQTDGLGNFFFAYVRPDTYTMKVSLAGFQTAERPDLVVNANDRLMAGVFTLAISKVAETVTVVGQSEDIQLRSGERAYTLQSQAIQNIAVNGRSFFGLVGLVPGVVPGPTQGGGSVEQVTQVSNFSANGARSNSNNMTIDGVANIDTGDNGGNMAQTNLDAIAEFKVLTSAYQAEYGRAIGAQVQVVTKSGTQSFRGSAYWYARRSDWNSNTWFNERSGTAKAKSARNDAGFTVGGPIYIPGTFNTSKDKLFFFFSQEFQRRTDPVSETRVTVPTALERNGDFSQSVDANGNPYPYIRDYTLNLPCSASNTSGCFQYQGVLGRIDPSRLYAPTLAALKLWPAANVSGQVGYNYKSQVPSSQPLNQSLIRMDYQVTNNWRMTGRYMFHSNKNSLPYGIGGWSYRTNVDTLNLTSDTPGRNWMVSSTGVINNTTSLEVSLGSAHNSLAHFTDSPAWTRTGAGMASLPMLFPNAIQNDYLPQMTFGGGRIGNPVFLNSSQAPFTNFNTTYDFITNLTKVIGTHAVKAGFYYQHSLKPQSAFASFNGNIDFSNSSNNSFDSQNGFANAALGIYNTFSQASTYAKPEWVYSNTEFYLQDNWKVKSRLTLDYGIRFYNVTPQWDRTQVASTFLPENFSASAAVRLFQPAVVNGTRVGYDASTGQVVNAAYIGRIVPNSGDRFQATYTAGQGVDKTLSDGSKFKLSPRVGFAYDLKGDQKMAVRGSFGIFYDRPQGNIVFDMVTNPPGMQTPSLQWGLVSGVATATPLYATSGVNPTAYAWKVPTVYAWNLGYQMQLPHQFTLDISTVGSESRNLVDQKQINALPYGTAFLASSQDPTRGVSCSGCSALSSLPGGNAKATDLLRPDQGYGAIRLWEFNAYSNYRSLQTSINRRFSKGLMGSFSYVYSSAKGIVNDDYGTARIDGKDEQANYGILAINRPHVFVGSVVYQLPAFEQGALGYLTNDWQLSGVYRWQSGAPYTIGYSIAGVGSMNITGSDQGARIVLNGDAGSGSSSDPYKQIANTSVFGPPQTGSIGIESPRYFVYGPPVNNLDLSVSKSFLMGGTRRFEIRLDAFNLFNHVQFSGINSTANFNSMSDSTIINLPYNSAGQLVNQNGFGTVSSQRSPRQLQLVMRFTF
jgi:hypothetical protein